MKRIIGIVMVVTIKFLMLDSFINLSRCNPNRTTLNCDAGDCSFSDSRKCNLVVLGLF